MCVEPYAVVDVDGEDHVFVTESVRVTDGGKLSIVGEFVNSIIDNEGEVWINKTTRIAADGYDKAFAALGKELHVKDGGIVRVLDGGQVIDSTISRGGKMMITNEGKYKYPEESGIEKSYDDPGIAINTTVESGGILYIHLGGHAKGTIVKDGGTETLQSEGTSYYTALQSGGRQHVTTGAVAEKTTIKSGAEQSVLREGIAQDSIADNGGKLYVYDAGVAYDAVVAEGGKLYVYNDGIAKNATVSGTQILYSTDGKSSGMAYNIKVMGNGAQKVQQGAYSQFSEFYDNAQHIVSSDALSEDINLYDSTSQQVRASGTVKNVTLHGNSLSWVSDGANVLGNMIVKDNAQVQMLAGEATPNTKQSGAAIENLNLTNHNQLLIISNTETSNHAFIKDLSGQGEIVFIDKPASDAPSINSQLHINMLSGQHTFAMNTSINEGKGDYLTVGQGTGQHGLQVKDSGREITQPMEHRLDMVTMGQGDAKFTLTSLDNVNIKAVDGGTYMYQLYSREGDSGEKIWYLASMK